MRSPHSGASFLRIDISFSSSSRGMVVQPDQYNPASLNKHAGDACTNCKKKNESIKTIHQAISDKSYVKAVEQSKKEVKYEFYDNNLHFADCRAKIWIFQFFEKT